VREELWLRKRLSALLLQTGHREAVLPDRSLLPTAMCLSETCLLQPLLRGSQVLCSGRLLCSGSVRCGSPLLPGSGCLLRSGSVRRSSLLRSSEVLCSGSGVCAGLLRSGSSLLPRSGRLLCSGSVCRSSLLRSSEVLPGSGDLRLPGSSLLRSSEVLSCSGDLWLPGSSLLRSSEVLPGSGLVLCSGLCAEVLCSGSGELLRSGCSDLQHVQFVRQRLQHLLPARLARYLPPLQGGLLPDLVHDDEGLLCRSLRSGGSDLQVADGLLCQAPRSRDPQAGVVRLPVQS
jgi:hypothetical protein